MGDTDEMHDDAGTAGEHEDGRRRFRLAYVPGATPAKWVRTWRERHPDVPLDLVATSAADAERVLRDGEADAAILRPPVDREVLAAIRLYEETPVVCVSRDHLLAALEEEEPVAIDDLVDDVLLTPLDDVVPWAGRPGAPQDAVPPPGRPAVERPATTADAVVLVAAGVGVLVVPQSLARLHHRKDVTYRSLEGGPTAPVALAWVAENDDELVEEMVGIVRGRTANSSRGRRPADAPSGTVPSSRTRTARDATSRDGRTRDGKTRDGKARGGTASGRSGRAAGRKGKGSRGGGSGRR